MSSFLAGDIAGHEGQLSLLSGLLKNSTLPHALLFSGPSSIGKRRVARGLAADIFAQGLGSCALSARELKNMLLRGSHPDLYMLHREEGKKNLPNEAVRQMCLEIQRRPTFSASVVIIDEAHLMSASAANSLLRSLEEPGANRYLILVSQFPQKIPETILSRCLELRFAKLGDGDIATVLKRILSSTGALPEMEAMLAMADGSLELFDLTSLVNAKTLEITDANSAAKRIEERSCGLLALEKELGTALRSPSPAPSVSLARKVAKERKEASLFPCLYATLRRELRSGADLKRCEKWADLLLELMETQMRISERNSSRELELSSSLLCVWNLRAGIS